MKVSRDSPWWPKGFGGIIFAIIAKVKTPDFLDVRHYKGGRSSAMRTGRLYPRINPWYSLSGAESTPGRMVASGGSHGKNPQ